MLPFFSRFSWQSWRTCSSWRKKKILDYKVIKRRLFFFLKIHFSTLHCSEVPESMQEYLKDWWILLSGSEQTLLALSRHTERAFSTYFRTTYTLLHRAACSAVLSWSLPLLSSYIIPFFFLNIGITWKSRYSWVSRLALGSWSSRLPSDTWWTFLTWESTESLKKMK